MEEWRGEVYFELHKFFYLATTISKSHRIPEIRSHLGITDAENGGVGRVFADELRRLSRQAAGVTMQKSSDALIDKAARKRQRATKGRDRSGPSARRCCQAGPQARRKGNDLRSFSSAALGR